MLCYDKSELTVLWLLVARQAKFNTDDFTGSVYKKMKRVHVMAKPTNGHRPLTLTSPKQRQGSVFEQQACQFLQQQGLELIAQNWQQPKIGELDLVMLETGQAWSTLVFIEVRQRLRSSFGDAALSVTKAKQRKIIKTAKYFLQQYPEYAHFECRFDVIAYDIERSMSRTAKHDNYNENNHNENNRKDYPTEHSTAGYQPEWLLGAFIATAW